MVDSDVLGKIDRREVRHQINVAAPGSWPDDYRIPDLVLFTPDRLHIVEGEYLDGGPNVVIEIHSPGDESYDKLPFYARIGVQEVWIIDRDSRQPEIFACSEGEYQAVPADANGWIRSGVTGVCLRATDASKLEIRKGDDRTTRQLWPERELPPK